MTMAKGSGTLVRYCVLRVMMILLNRRVITKIQMTRLQFKSSRIGSVRDEAEPFMRVRGYFID